LRTRSPLIIAHSMEHILMVLMSDFTHVVVLDVRRSPAIVDTSSCIVWSEEYPAYCPQTTNKSATADHNDEDDGSVA
jgi:hypothetical protein